MREMAARADHVLLGTATPYPDQRSEDLWDLMGILHQGEGSLCAGQRIRQMASSTGGSTRPVR